MKFKLEQDVRIGNTLIKSGSVIRVSSTEKKSYSTLAGDINIHWEVERVVAQDGVDDFPSDYIRPIKDRVSYDIMKQLGENHYEGDLQGMVKGLEYVGYWTMNRK